MKLKVLGSNSAGNCYLLENDHECLVIELGVKFMQVKKAVDFNLAKIVGAIVTHEHGDHSKAIPDALKAGMRVYATKGTHQAVGTLGHHRATVIKAHEVFKVGSFEVLPFDVRHDCAEPVGFLIRHAETGVVLFLTDTFYSPYKFTGLNNLIVECNYSKEVIDQRVAEGKTMSFLRDRILKSHMNLETLKAMLVANDLSQVHHVVLIHLSDSNSDASLFEQTITTLTQKKVTVADAGLVIDRFTKSPFD